MKCVKYSTKLPINSIQVASAIQISRQKCPLFELYRDNLLMRRSFLDSECSLLTKLRQQLTGVALQPSPNECDALLSGGSDLVTEEIND